MIRLQIFGARRTTKKLSGMSKQAKFALAQTINEVLVETQEYTTRSILPAAFTLRSKGGNKWWHEKNKYGFRVRKAHKTRLEGRLGSAADWLEDHEEGGVRSSFHRRAVPDPFWKKKSEIIAKAKKPRPLRVKAAAAKTSRRRGKIKGLKAAPILLKKGIFARVGGILQPLFRFIGKAKIRKTLYFEKKAIAFAKKRIPAAFARAWAHALKTAK